VIEIDVEPALRGLRAPMETSRGIREFMGERIDLLGDSLR
jgi:hypothetical protein